MTIRELTEVLSQYDPDYHIIFETEDGVLPDPEIEQIDSHLIRVLF